MLKNVIKFSHKLFIWPLKNIKKLTAQFFLMVFETQIFNMNNFS